MKFIEYKKHLISGELRDPEFITNGGHWHDSVNHTFIAVVPDEVKYYLPDTLSYLTKEQLISRALLIHQHTPFILYNGIPGSGGVPSGKMNEDQVREMVATWTDSLNE